MLNIIKLYILQRKILFAIMTYYVSNIEGWIMKSKKISPVE